MGQMMGGPGFSMGKNREQSSTGYSMGKFDFLYTWGVEFSVSLEE